MTISFWLILSAALLYGLLHSFLASLKVKAVFKEWLGERHEQWFRVVYNLMAIFTFLPIVGLIVLLPDARIYVIHYPWVILSSLLQLLAVITLVIGLHQTGIGSFLGLSQLFLPTKTESTVLVTGGLYRFVRHPLYTAGLIFIWLTPILSWNILAFNVGLTIYILFGLHIEEKKLRRIYGEAYEQYRRTTPALIPGIRKPDQKRN